MADFPKLTTGAVTQYPSGRRSTYSTHVSRFVDGTEQRFRELKAPVHRWLIHLDRISSHEVSAIEMFFHAMEGEFGSFRFIDPWDDSEHADCSLDQQELQALYVAEDRIKSYLVIRKNTL